MVYYVDTPPQILILNFCLRMISFWYRKIANKYFQKEISFVNFLLQQHKEKQRCNHFSLLFDIYWYNWQNNLTLWFSCSFCCSCSCSCSSSVDFTVFTIKAFFAKAYGIHKVICVACSVILACYFKAWIAYNLIKIIFYSSL